jgi:hypothetical protein
VNHSRRPLYSHGGVNRDHFQQRRGCYVITNLMVMGPGGYRANDYFRCGLPLAILMGICALTLIPIVAPFCIVAQF